MSEGFLYRDSYQGKITFKTSTAGQIAGFFDHRYLWMKTINALRFFCLEIVNKER